MDNEKLFELMEKMYVEMKDGFKKVDERFSTLEGDVSGLKEDVSSVKKTAAKIEVEHGSKLNALLDGYKQNSEQIEQIKNEVIKHEEVILRRVK